MRACPCQSGRTWEDCCGACLDRGEAASTPEALMRSRYSAYVLDRRDYLLATWHSSTRPAQIDAPPAGLRWLGLELRRCATHGDGTAVVEFVARSKLGGRAHRLHETSRFVFEDGRWSYVDGDIA